MQTHTTAVAWQFLAEDATPDQLLQAIAENLSSWVVRCVQCSAGEINQGEGVTWVYSPGPEGDATILFPHLPAHSASAQLDLILASFRQHLPERDVLCWSLDPTEPTDLDARLLARGFEWNWQPHWMALPLKTLRFNQNKTPGLHIEIVENVPYWDVEDLPYYSPTAAEQLHRTSLQMPRMVWHFAAWLNGHVVGQSRLNLTTGDLGVAGIFDVAVVPSMRNKGIGKALTLAACQLALSMGCHHAVLNASTLGEPVYLRLGFASLGYGKTWLLRRPALASPPQPPQIQLIEALGQSNISCLDALAQSIDPALYSASMLSGMTPLQIVVGLQLPLSAEWLVAHGVTLDVLSAWDLGWQERAHALLLADPQQVNIRQGRRLATPLHIAVERNDADLLALLLSAHPDLSLKDSDFQATPLEWARFLNRSELLLLLEYYQSQATDS